MLTHRLDTSESLGDHLQKDTLGASLVVQWLELHASTAGDTDSIPGGGTKIPHAVQCGKKKRQMTGPHPWKSDSLDIPGVEPSLKTTLI